MRERPGSPYPFREEPGREGAPAPLPKVADYVHDYAGYGNAPSRCRIRVFAAEGRAPVVVASELPDDSGTSVTNMAEVLAAEVATRHFPHRLEEAEPFVWVEHYPREEWQRRLKWPEYAIVTFASYVPRVERRWGELYRKLGAPRWTYVAAEEVGRLIGDHELDSGQGLGR